jgi:hypothetical protein
VRGFWRKLPLGNDWQAQGIYEWVQRDIGYLIRNESQLVYDNWTHQYEVPLFGVAAELAVPTDAWWRLLDSLLRLQRSRGDTTGIDCSNTSNNTGLQYTVPFRTKLSKGWMVARYCSETPCLRQLRR